MWELVGDPGKRNGGKLLRARLIALPQWTDHTIRLETVRRGPGRGPRPCAADVTSFFPPSPRAGEARVNSQTGAHRRALQARTAIQLGHLRVAQALVDARSADLQKGEPRLLSP